MSDTGKQSPLGVNVMGSLLLNEGLCINPVVTQYAGASRDDSSYTPGSIVNDTCLKWLTYAINDAFNRGYPSGTNQTVSNATYDNLLSIGQSRIPALGNSPPPTYIVNDPSEVWGIDNDPNNCQAVFNYSQQFLDTDPSSPTYYQPVSPTDAAQALPGPATSGYGVVGITGAGQNATWYPYNTDNPNVQSTQWGWVRLLALQAWNDFNWNGKAQNPADPNYEPAYKDYVSSYMTLEGFVNYSNSAIYTMRNSIEFLKGTYSNMNDLISADITGITLSTQAFGQDLINLGRAINLNKISTFGLPSNLLIIIKQNGAITQDLNLAMLSVGLTPQEVNSIADGEPASKDQEQKLYSAFLIITDQALRDITAPLNCKTKGLTTLADLLNVKKLFPISYTTLTVPIYNAGPGPTNSKTYYLLYVNREMNPQLLAPAIVEQVGTIIPPEPPPVEEPPPPPVIVQPPPVVVEQPKPPPTGGAIGGGGCVVLDAYLPTVETRMHNGKPVEKAYQIENEFDILLADETLKSVNGKVVKAMIDFQPCVKIITASGIRLSCSTTAPILTKNKGYVEAPKLFGELIAVMRNDIAFWDEVVSIDDIGYKHVRVIDTGNNSFWAGDIQNAYILHHNARISDALDYDKK